MVQMLDGSISPFKVRSTITIASLKAKFEPWQPMKGRALLHHNVQLDDRAVLGFVPGVKNGTILRFDSRVSQVKSKANGKRSMMSGPPDLEEDEDVVESIETSSNDDERSSGNERRLSGSERNLPLRISTAVANEVVDKDNSVNSSQKKRLLLDELSDDPPNMTDTSLSNSAATHHIVKKEKRKTTSPERAVASEAQHLDQRNYSLTNVFASPSENSPGSPTAGVQMAKTIDIVPSHRV